MEATTRKKWEYRGRAGSEGSKKKHKQKTKTKHWGEKMALCMGGKKKEKKGWKERPGGGERGGGRERE